MAHLKNNLPTLVQWSAHSTPTLSTQVLIPLKSTVLAEKHFLKRTKIGKQKGDGPIKNWTQQLHISTTNPSNFFHLLKTNQDSGNLF